MPTYNKQWSTVSQVGHFGQKGIALKYSSYENVHFWLYVIWYTILLLILICGLYYYYLRPTSTKIYQKKWSYLQQKNGRSKSRIGPLFLNSNWLKLWEYKKINDFSAHFGVLLADEPSPCQIFGGWSEENISIISCITLSHTPFAIYGNMFWVWFLEYLPIKISLQKEDFST